MQTQIRWGSWGRRVLAFLLVLFGVGATTSAQPVKAEEEPQTETMKSTAEFRIVGDIPDLEVKPPVGEVIPPKPESGNSSSNKPYPQTGEKQSQSLSLLGFGLVIAMLGLIIRGRRRQNGSV